MYRSRFEICRPARPFRFNRLIPAELTPKGQKAAVDYLATHSSLKSDSEADLLHGLRLLKNCAYQINEAFNDHRFEIDLHGFTRFAGRGFLV